MKHLFSTIAILASLWHTADVAAAEPMLVIDLNGAPSQTFTLNETIRLTPSSDSLIVSSAHLRVAYPLASVSKYHFVPADNYVDAIEEIALNQQSGVSILRDGTRLIISGLPYEAGVQVFSQSGAKQQPPVHKSPTTLIIDFAPLPSGIYIITPTNSPSLPTIKYLHKS